MFLFARRRYHPNPLEALSDLSHEQRRHNPLLPKSWTPIRIRESALLTDDSVERIGELEGPGNKKRKGKKEYFIYLPLNFWRRCPEMGSNKFSPPQTMLTPIRICECALLVHGVTES
jgi:hypothetical protein